MYSVKTFFTFLILFTLNQACTQRDVWQLQWADEFDEPGAPDSEYWEYETGFVRNRELQYYTDSEKNIRAENGKLIITARAEEKGWIPVPCL